MSATILGLRELLSRNLRQSGIMIALIAIVVLFSALNPNFLSPGNLTNIILQYSYILILSIGMMIVIIGGHIDLSVGSLIALTGGVSAVLVVKHGMPWWVGVLAAVGVGILAGMWQGFWVAVVGIPAFIVTLGGMLLFRGLAYQVLNNVSLSPFGGTYYEISNGFLNGLLGGQGFDVFTVLIFAVAVVGYIVLQLRERLTAIRHHQGVPALPLFIAKLVIVTTVVMAFGYQISRARGLPFVLIILAILVMSYSVIMRRTTFGRHVYAIGGNLSAALLSGVKVKRDNFLIMVNMGLLSGIAGVVYSARMNGAQPGAGNMFELDAIAACFIGGAAITGGVGRITGAMIGGLIMAIMTNGMQLMGVSTSTQQVVKGLVLLLAVAFDVFNKRRAGGK